MLHLIFVVKAYMARIKISVPEHFSYSTYIPVRISDVNYGGHVGNDTLLGIVHEARIQFLKEFNYSEMNFAGIGLIMADVAIEFKNEAFYGDIIKVSVTATDIGRVSFDLCYKMEKKSDDTMVAIAKTGMVCFDYKTRKVAMVPEEAKQKIQQ